MKKLLHPFFALLISLHSFSLMAQTPEGISYQAVARNTNGGPISNQHINLRFTIHDTNPQGNMIYQETDTATTNIFGLFTTTIGLGNLISGNFDLIPWDQNKKFLQVEYDPTGAFNFIDMGTSELVSVPYSLYAKRAGTIAGSLNQVAYGTGTSLAYDSGFYRDQLISETGIEEIDGNRDYGIAYIVPSRVALAYIKSSGIGWGFEADSIEGGSTIIVADSIHFKWPNYDGTPNQVLTTDGHTRLRWSSYNNGWSLTGNSATSSATNYLGTSDEQSLLFKINGRLSGALNDDSIENANTAFGYLSNKNNSGSNNSAFGVKALNLNTTGNGNTAIGLNALHGNTTGSFNMGLGDNADVISNNLINATAIGYNAKAGISNSMILGGTGANAVYVGIGLDTPTTILDVRQLNATTLNTIRFGAVNATAYIGAVSGYFGFSDNNQVPRLAILQSNGYVGINKTNPAYQLDVNGTVAGTGAYVNASDARYKKNIQPINEALTLIERLKPVKYDWNKEAYPDKNFDSRSQLGFIAQEVEPVLPEAVSKDADGYYGISYTTIVPVLVKAMQEQQLTIEKLNARIYILEKKLSAR